ncbi:hypothetical protein S726_000170 [Salmonella enterica subsp. enterica]|nr:hypothetical protein [Salmonella enterica subsp. enterica]
MAVKWVTGKIGAGKGLYCDYEMRKYYREGRRVVTNYPVDTRLLNPDSENPVIVLPSWPRAEDLYALGRGCPDSEKEKFGAIFLDEASLWLNSRTYADKSRLSLIEWFVLSRHFGWDVFIVVQNEEMIDKQIVLALGEILVVCKRSDRTRSIIGKMFRALLSGKKDQGNNKQDKPVKSKSFFRHRVIVEIYHERKSKRDKPFEKFSFYADWYFGIHDTNFIFDNGFEVLTYPGGKVKTVDMRCMYSLLPGKTIKQWYHANDVVAKEPVISKGRLFSGLFFAVGTVLCWYFMIHNKKQEEQIAVSSASRSHAAGAAAVQPGNVELLPSLPPPPPALSSTWRLTGYLKSSGGSPRYVIRDNAGNVRYIASDKPWDGSYSEILVDGERVTFWTGSAQQSGTVSRDYEQPVSSPFSSAVGSAKSALGIGEISR